MAPPLCASPQPTAERATFSTSRTLAVVLGALTVLLVALTNVAPAGAVLTPTISPDPEFGVQQREAPAVDLTQPLQYHKGSVLHSSDAYVIYWDPKGGYRGDWERLIDKYFQDVGTESGHLGDIFALDGQYGAALNQMTFRGSYTDSNPYPTEAEGACTPSASASACLTDALIQEQIKKVINSVAPPLPGATGTPVYYLLTPPGVTVCAGSPSAGTCSNSTALEAEVATIEAEPPPKAKVKAGICGYHSFVPGTNRIPYVVQPWIAGSAGRFILKTSPSLETSDATADVLACQDNSALEEPNQLAGLNPFGNYAEGLADVIISDLSIEQRNVVIDPFLDGWYQETTKAEQGDMCQFNFGPPPATPPTANGETHAATLSNELINGDSFYIPWAFDSADITAGKGATCWSGVALEPYFTAPNPVNAGDIIGFNSESNFTLDANTKGLPANEPYIAAVYTWNFGDGTEAKGATAFHSYEFRGTYPVTLTIKDSADNVNTTTRDISVVTGPARPERPAGASGSGAAAAGGGTTAPSGAVPASVPKPLATAAIVSRSLKTAARKGLVVRYSVNEQVAGRFEVLLSRTAAKRLGIGGPPALGLPAGTPPEVVIAKAILITTKAGRSTLSIPFSKRTAGGLRHAAKLTVTLRLIVRNAASHSPASTTVVTAATLSH